MKYVEPLMLERLPEDRIVSPVLLSLWSYVTIFCLMKYIYYVYLLLVPAIGCVPVPQANLLIRGHVPAHVISDTITSQYIEAQLQASISRPQTAHGNTSPSQQYLEHSRNGIAFGYKPTSLCVTLSEDQAPETATCAYP
jgi:hypothetical protein